MHKGRKVGIILILVGLCLQLVSFAFVSNYNPEWGVLDNISSMELVIKEGYSQQKEIDYAMSLPDPAPAPDAYVPGEPFPKEEPSYKEWIINDIKAHPDEIRIALPYKYFYCLDIILIFLGIGLVIFGKLEKKESAKA